MATRLNLNAPKSFRSLRTPSDNSPPVQADGDATTAKLRAVVRGLRQTAHGDPATIELCSEVERLINSGWIERRGGPQPRRLPLHPAWKGREPPENP